MGMRIVYERCAGLDVHKKTVVACALLSPAQGQSSRQVRTFATTTSGLRDLWSWLESQGVSHVAMESTGIYWRPVFNMLEGHVEVILVNAQHMKAVPGRKTDVKDSEWIADLLSHGLLTASFIPPKALRDLRDLVRARQTLVQQRAQTIQRVQKVLETANIKLSSLATNVLGVSGRAMLEAMLAGVSDAETLAQLARKRLRAKLPALREALEGQVEATHRQVLRQLLNLLDFLQGQIESLTSDIEAQLSAYETSLSRLRQIPGVGQQAAVAWAISHTRDNYLSTQYHRLARRIGKPRAIVAVSHSVLVIIYHLLRDSQDYHDLGPHFFETLDTQRQRDSAVRRLEALGYQVTLADKKEENA